LPEVLLLFCLCTLSILVSLSSLSCILLYSTTHNTNIHDSAGIQTLNPIKQATANLRYRPLGHREPLEPATPASDKQYSRATDRLATGRIRTQNCSAHSESLYRLRCRWPSDVCNDPSYLHPNVHINCNINN
jgi:hypothetical protein